MMRFGKSRRGSGYWSRPVWMPLERYLDHHFSHMHALEEYFVIDDNLSFNVVADSVLLIRGSIRCRFGIDLSVDKVLDVDAENRVSGRLYSYHCRVGNPPRNLLRYDNAHAYRELGHRDAYHKHLFDPSTGDELQDSPHWIGIDRWPTLRQVLDELFDWWQDEGHELFPELDSE